MSNPAEFRAKMPVNIALIKYIGKDQEEKNQALHATISLRLPRCYTTVTLRAQPEQRLDTWCMHKNACKLSPQQIERFLDHLRQIKQHYNFAGCFSVYSQCNFPVAAGLASSASSFAALTVCAVDAVESILGIKQQQQLSNLEKAHLSRQGSGSACRSFFGPWCIWDKNSLQAKSFAEYDQLVHVALIISTAQKHISTSQAHELVTTSPLFAKRQDAIKQRYRNFLSALQHKDWGALYNIAWEEFIEMHRLCHTSKPSFSYCSSVVTKTLEILKSWWHENGDGPIVTMDAGPNIHLFFRQDQLYLRKRLLRRLRGIPMLYGTESIVD